MELARAVIVATLALLALVSLSRPAGASSAGITGLQYKLPLTAVPTKYILDLAVYVPTNNSYSGSAVITVYAAHGNVNFLTLHVDHDHLNITSAYLYDPDSLVSYPFSLYNDTETQTTRFALTSSMTVGTKYQMYVYFSGELRDDMYGFYRSNYTNTTTSTTNILAATRFQPTYARSAFPCWDEPDYKATFVVKITHNSTLTAVSNAASSSTASTSTNYTKTTFSETELMSPSDLGILVSNFSTYESNNTNTTTVSVYARSDRISQGEFAATFAASVLDQLQTYLNVNFTTFLSKLDLAAVPDMATCVLGNWGLINFRESSLLYGTNESTESAKQVIALGVAHEAARMWIGGLTTPAWWSFLWLSQGFARYFEYVFADLVETDWRLMETFVVDSSMAALAADSLQSSHSLSADVYSPLEVAGAFDTITYDKGAAILHMIRNVTGDTYFQYAVYNYTAGMEYNSATPSDLFRSLSYNESSYGLSSGVTFNDVLDSWVFQAGYPLITVILGDNGTYANVTQALYSTSNSSSLTKWYVPLTFTTQSSLNFSDTSVTWLDPSADYQMVTVSATTGWVIFNVRHVGFYRVNYDANTWANITSYLQNSSLYTNIHVLNRAQIIDDALDLAKSGVISYALALNLTEYLAYEVDPIPWTAAFNQLNFLSYMLYNTSANSYLTTYMQSLLSTVYGTIGFNESSSDDHITLTFREKLLLEACYVDVGDCVSNATSLFSNLTSSNTSVALSARKAVYCVAVRNGSSSNWDYLWDMFVDSEYPSERELILTALGCTTNTTTLYSYLNTTLYPNISTVRAQDALTVFKSVLYGNPSNFDVAYNFVLTNFTIMLNSTSYGAWPVMREVITGISSMITSTDILTEFKTLIESSMSSGYLNITETTLSNLMEPARINLAWQSTHLSTVKSWLASSSKGAGLRGTLLTFLLACVVSWSSSC